VLFLADHSFSKHDDNVKNVHIAMFTWYNVRLLQSKVSPVMCCYKLVTIEFKWFGLQTRVEKFIQKVCAQALYKQ